MVPAHDVAQQGVLERNDRPQDDLGGGTASASVAAAGTCSWAHVVGDGGHGGALASGGAT